LSTVDKFANLPWEVRTNALFGRVDRKCSRDGYVAIGEDHPQRHNRTDSLEASTLTPVKQFLPPELIIQDELHLITGPLGTVYGAYETIIEDMCTYDGIKPKYVVSTATIKNAEAQAKCLYARQHTTQFPPSGFEIGDSFFIKEIPIEKDPFRKYVGICAPGQSVKTALLRVYSIILQAAHNYSCQDEFKDVIDPYYTLVGYFNSIRELGGAVRLLQDDIPKRIKRIKKKYDFDSYRNLFHNVEITSRMASYKIPEKLNQLEINYESRDCLDTAIATNMIAVGMDVDRLGLMVVTGQPKQNSEYIQATSRIGRAFPGLVVTLYNAYRPRDLSHYENFTGYHSQLYRFVEGTTATPFSARARDRVLHALIISAIRLNYPEMAENASASLITSMTDDQLVSVKNLIIDRLNIIKPSAKIDAENEIDQFIDWWKLQASQIKKVRYFVVDTKYYNRLMNSYDQPHIETEKPTLRSMREVESTANMYYYTEE
uniref:helicase-related protein n=1 Tax=Eubacterium sp. TaxID=142586 RepID=UPI0025E32C24